MGLENKCNSATLVRLHPLPKMLDELDRIINAASQEAAREVAIDFSSVDIITTPAIARLMTLRRLLIERGHRLVLCSLRANTKDIFTLTGLDEVFEFADDVSAVPNTVEMT